MTGQIGIRLTQTSICLLVGLIPLAYWPGVYEYALLPKKFVLYLGLTGASLGLILRFCWRPISFPNGPLILPLAALALATVGSVIQSTHRLDSLVEITYQVSLIALGFICALGLNAARLRPILLTHMWVGLAVALLGILQYHDLAPIEIPSNGMPSATFGYRNFAAMYLICAIPFHGILFLTSNSRSIRALAAFTSALMGIFLVYTRTRGA